MDQQHYGHGVEKRKERGQDWAQGNLGDESSQSRGSDGRAEWCVI